MKTCAALLIVLLSLPCAADDLFRADGQVNVGRTLIYKGRTYLCIQLGSRQADGRIEIYHKDGRLLVTEADIPVLWVRALARREAQAAAPAGAAPGAAGDFVRKLGEAMLRATWRLTTPQALVTEKSSGGMFTGQIVACTDTELLVTSGATVAWVPDSYFKSSAIVRASFTVTTCPELYAIARAAAEKVARNKGQVDWPDNFTMQQWTYERQMEAWDKQYPRPKMPGKTEAVVDAFDPFAGK